MRPERDELEIHFPRVAGYRVELPEERLTAAFNEDSVLELTPDMIGPSHTTNQGIIGEGVDLNLVHTGDLSTAHVNFTTSKTSRWAFAEFTDVYEIESEFEAKIEAVFDEIIERSAAHCVSM